MHHRRRIYDRPASYVLSLSSALKTARAGRCGEKEEEYPRDSPSLPLLPVSFATLPFLVASPSILRSLWDTIIKKPYFLDYTYRQFSPKSN